MTAAPGAEAHARLWSAVDRLIDRTDSLSRLRAHRMHLLAVRRWRSLGRSIPTSLRREVESATVVGLAAEALLRKVASVYGEPLLSMKGPEVASYYAESWSRPYVDVDLLARDADAVYAALIEAGFEPIGFPEEYYRDLHHLRPLSWPGLPARVEVHRHPSWVFWAEPPDTEELFATARPARVGPPSILAPSPAAHALLIACHSWSEVALRRTLDLVDIAALTSETDVDETRELAHAWGLARLWKTMSGAVDDVFYETGRSSAVRTWARDIAEIRERTVLENHFRRWIGSFWALPFGRAATASMWMLLREVLPAHDETWRDKLSRMQRALRNAFSRMSEHNRELGDRAHRFPRKPARFASARRDAKRRSGDKPAPADADTPDDSEHR